MEASFLGRYEHSLDGKGRVILPAKFRGFFDTRAFVTKHAGRCLAIWTPDAFSVIRDQMQALIDGPDAAERARARAWAAGATEVDLDRQGRVGLPQHQRTFADLAEGQTALVLGAISHIELWNPALWEVQESAGDAALGGEG